MWLRHTSCGVLVSISSTDVDLWDFFTGIVLYLLCPDCLESSIQYSSPSWEQQRWYLGTGNLGESEGELDKDREGERCIEEEYNAEGWKSIDMLFRNISVPGYRNLCKKENVQKVERALIMSAHD